MLRHALRRSSNLGRTRIGRTGTENHRPSRPATRGRLRRTLDFTPLEARVLLSGDTGLGHPLGGDPRLDASPPVEISAAGSTTTTSATATSSSTTTYPLSSVPSLSSLPGARVSIYLDFVGDTESQWGSYTNITTPAYDIDGDPTTFSSAELANIQQIWQGVAEDYAPFNVNVMTVPPPSLAHGVTVKDVIGGNGSWTGGTYGGLSYVGAFTTASLPNVSFIFSDNLGGGYPKDVMDAASHEAGHEFGLQHQSLWSGSTLVQPYYAGPGDGTAPIMGNSYNSPLSRWWYGTSSSCSTCMQDDMAIIAGSANGFGYRPTPTNTTPATAAPLAVSGTSVSASGVIITTADTDYFSFTTGAGTVTLSANVPQGENDLTPQLLLYDATGTTLIASAGPGASYNATITTTLAAGTYKLVVASSGGYGNVGEYTIGGTIVTPTNTINPPTGLTATAVSTSQVNLAWTDNATNETGYSVVRSTDGVHWTVLTSDLPAGATSYSDTTAATGTTYDYEVQAFNASLTSAYSNLANATTITVAPSGLTATAASSGQINLSWGDVAGETGFVILRSSDGSTWSTVATTGAGVTSYHDTGVAATTTYYYEVEATDAGGPSAPSNMAVATTPPTVLPPAAPTGLTAIATSARSVSLAWSESSANVTSFVIQRSSNGGKSWSSIAQVSGTVLSYIDTTVSKGKTYSYRIYASNSAGNSGYSNVATVTTPSAASLVGPGGAAALGSTSPGVVPPDDAALPQSGAALVAALVDEILSDRDPTGWVAQGTSRPTAWSLD